MDAGPGDITALLARMSDGDPSIPQQLLPLVYRELELIARAYVHGASSLEPQGLVHELYLRLARSGLEAHDRRHFYAAAAMAMRQILTDRARRKHAAKRGGDALAVSLAGLATDAHVVDTVAIAEALARLEELSPRQARVVELRCLVGLTVPEVADALAVSERTIAAEWRLARAWLLRELGTAAMP